jgi:hypothetical protein
MAEDCYLPSGFATRGRRLVFSQGIGVLAVLAAFLLILFGGVTDRLIPLYAVGAFLAFTLSQAGMVMHWKRMGGPRALRSMLVNAVGAVTTAITVLVVAVAKFAAGAWVTVLLIPAMIILMESIRRHYDGIVAETTDPAPLDLNGLRPPLVVVPLLRWSKICKKAIRLAVNVSPDVLAVHVGSGDEAENLQERWPSLVEGPAKEAGFSPPSLVVLESPYRFVLGPIVNYVLELEKKNPDRQVAVLIPELVESHWHNYLIHNQRAQWLKALLLLKGTQRIVVINVPWYVEC